MRVKDARGQRGVGLAATEDIDKMLHGSAAEAMTEC